MRILNRTWMFLALLSIAGVANAFGMVDYFRAVAQSDTLKQIVDQGAKDGFELRDVSRKVTYRCPGCYRFDVVLDKYDPGLKETVTVTHKLATRLDLGTGKIEVGIQPQ